MLSFDRIPSILLQFYLSDFGLVPNSVKGLPRKVPVGGATHHTTNGVRVVPPTKSCTVRNILEDFERMGYKLIDACYFPTSHQDPKNAELTKVDHVVRFQFAHPRLAGSSPEFDMVKDQVIADLGNMCKSALWRLRLFSNPFYVGEEEIPDERTVCIVLDSQELLFRDNGKPTLVWERDAHGVALPKAPRRLKAKHNLRVLGETDVLALTTA